jgi:hypothetical protein
MDELDLADWRERVARLYLSDVGLAGSLLVVVALWIAHTGLR